MIDPRIGRQGLVIMTQDMITDTDSTAAEALLANHFRSVLGESDLARNREGNRSITPVPFIAGKFINLIWKYIK
jgi:hypothetical protein